MRIAIDTNALYMTQAGVARYVRKLMQAERRLKQDLELIEVGWPVENYHYQQPQRALKTAYRELVWCNLVAPRKIRESRAEAFHSTANIITHVPTSVPHVVTVHDLAYFRTPERFRRWQRFSGRNGFRQLRKAKQIICISKFTIRELKEVLGIDDERVSLIYYGCPFHSEEGAPPERKPDFEVPPEFFLFVSSLEPGKNVRLIRSAYELAESRRVQLPPLLLAGARWEGVANEGPPPANWRYLGHQTDETLVYLYRRAQALLFPSRYEGFGLPVIESLSLGCPVICSPVASLPEAGGDAAYYAEMNPRAYLEAMMRLLREPQLRADLVEKGRIHSEKFAWSRCAAETVEVYRKAIER